MRILARWRWLWLSVVVACAPASPPAARIRGLSTPALSAPTQAPQPELPAPSSPPPDPGRANNDPNDDQVTGPPEPIADCEARLRDAGVKFRAGAIPVRAQPAGFSCGAPQVVIYESGPTGVKWNAAPAVTCQLALGLARFEALVAESAASLLGKRVIRIHQGGTYSCRKMARFKLASEHSYANAIDIRSFELDDGSAISVKRHFGKLDAEPTAAEAKFLRSVARRAFQEDVFSVVLTPYWDKLHADHFHLDAAHFRVDGTQP